MDLFEYMRSTNMEKEAPLAPECVPEPWMRSWGRSILSARTSFCIVPSSGQDQLHHFLWTPGTGKTTLAKVIANTTSAEFNRLMPQWRAKRIWKKWWQRRRNCRECIGSVQFCSLTRSTVLIKDNRIICSRMWRTVRSFS